MAHEIAQDAPSKLVQSALADLGHLVGAQANTQADRARASSVPLLPRAAAAALGTPPQVPQFAHRLDEGDLAAALGTPPQVPQFAHRLDEGDLLAAALETPPQVPQFAHRLDEGDLAGAWTPDTLLADAVAQRLQQLRQQNYGRQRRQAQADAVRPTVRPLALYQPLQAKGTRGSSLPPVSSAYWDEAV